MRIRNERGAITPAEGCLFGAVALFGALFLAMVYIAFLRFREPPAGPPGAPSGAPRSSAVGYRLLEEPVSISVRWDGGTTERPHA